MGALKHYGLPYQGSKSQVAESICKFLPAGKRLVDLFGGGGAISHCASLSYKWDKVLYNELDTLVVKALTMSIEGAFNGEDRWISRDEFFNSRASDPYVALCFSWGFNKRTYSYAPYLESWKKALHYIKFWGDYSIMEDEVGIKYHDKNKLYHFANNEIFPVKKTYRDTFRLESAECLQRLNDIRLEKPLEIINGTYLNYTYEAGDVVYCDPPYEATDQRGYKGPSFDSEEFYSWVESRPYQVFFSSYEALKLNERFVKLWKERKRVLSNSVDKRLYADEVIYSNRGTPLREYKEQYLF